MSISKTIAVNESLAEASSRVWKGSQVTSHSSPDPIDAHEITRSSWAAFCRWLTSSLADVTTTIVRDEGADRRMVECLERPLERIEVVQLADGVSALKVSARMNGNAHVFEVAGPSWLRVHYNSAGFIRLLEIGYQEGKMVLRFTGAPALSSSFTANSWGE